MSKLGARVAAARVRGWRARAGVWLSARLFPALGRAPTPISPLAQALRPEPPRPTTVLLGQCDPVTARVTVNTIATQIQAAVLACLRGQAHLFPIGDPRARRAALGALVESLVDGEWSPDGIAPALYHALDQRALRGMVWACVEGVPYNGAAEALYAQLVRPS